MDGGSGEGLAVVVVEGKGGVFKEGVFDGGSVSLGSIGREEMAAMLLLDRNPTLLSLGGIHCLYDGVPRAPPIVREVVSCMDRVEPPWGIKVSSGELTNDAIQKRLCRVFTYLPALWQIAPRNLLAAGGSVVAALRGQVSTVDYLPYNGVVDVDLFLYDVSSEEATSLLRQMVGVLMEGGAALLVRGSHHVSVKVGKTVYQVKLIYIYIYI